jgi:hypothetical protein
MKYKIHYELPEAVTAIDGSEPHPHHKGWKNFIRNCCELRDTFEGVQFFGVTNCNYIVFPCGTLVQNYGYHGRAIMNDIREKGKDPVIHTVRTIHSEVKEALACMREGRLYRHSDEYKKVTAKKRIE